MANCKQAVKTVLPRNKTGIMGKRIEQDAGNTPKTEGGEGPRELLEQLETNYNNY